MSTVKVIEVMANSTKSWEDAAQTAVTHVGKTIRDIKSVWIQDQNAIVINNKITEYRVTAKISFEVDLTIKK